jgi:hypothetical protein
MVYGDAATIAAVSRPATDSISTTCSAVACATATRSIPVARTITRTRVITRTASGSFHLRQQRFNALGKPGTHAAEGFRNQIFFGPHFKHGVTVFIACFRFGGRKNPHKLKLPLFQKWQQPATLFNQFEIGRNGGNSIPVRSQRDARFKRDSADAALEEFIFQRLQAIFRGQNVVEQNALVHEAKGKMARLFHQRIQ